jgi:hypothetical protein
MLQDIIQRTMDRLVPDDARLQQLLAREVQADTPIEMRAVCARWVNVSRDGDFLTLNNILCPKYQIGHARGSFSTCFSVYQPVTAQAVIFDR